MDALFTPEELNARERVRAYFRGGRGGGADGGESAFDALRVLKDLGLGARSGAGFSGLPGLVGAALVVDEFSRVSPRLGLALLAGWGPPGPASGPEHAAATTAWDLGTTSAAYDACLEAARGRGFFGSTLMGHQRVQMDLAGILAGLEAARLQAYRAMRLIDRGRRDRGGEELERARQLAGRTCEAAKALAATLLGQDRVQEIFPERERSRP
ncbi:MAG TPA: acyl-CoA dehydrogenase family protein [Burkholderiales bacterium]|nr:acyl-CoA dehydrogenase family protein [Burkholderiales bacterium]